MKARKLASGAWNCVVFSHYIIKDGKKKKISKSITVDDPSPRGKRKCERLAAEFALNRDQKSNNLLVYDAVKRYIDSKRSVLSPSTLRSYLSMLDHAYAEIGAIPLHELTQADIQMWVSRVSEKNSPKTVRNKYNLLMSAIDMFSDRKFKVSLPAPKKADLHTPTTEEVQMLLDHVSANPKSTELEMAIRLAAFCGLRLGEICALEDTDFKDGLITVSKAREPDPDVGYVTKQPKTYSGYRTVKATESVTEAVKDIKGRVIKAEPDVVSKRFMRAIRYTFHGEVVFRFHDLRHYYASVTHAIGVPDEYIMKSGGWKTDYVMKRIYRGTMSDEEEKQAEKIADFFQNLDSAK